MFSYPENPLLVKWGFIANDSGLAPKSLDTNSRQEHFCAA
jgi:hypothetical protein